VESGVCPLSRLDKSLEKTNALPLHDIFTPKLANLFFNHALPLPRAAVNSVPFQQWMKSLGAKSGLLTLGGSRGARVSLRSVLIQSVDFFGKRVGFVKFKAEVVDEKTGKTVRGLPLKPYRKRWKPGSFFGCRSAISISLWLFVGSVKDNICGDPTSCCEGVCRAYQFRSKWQQAQHALRLMIEKLSRQLCFCSVHKEEEHNHLEELAKLLHRHLIGHVSIKSKCRRNFSTRFHHVGTLGSFLFNFTLVFCVPALFFQQDGTALMSEES
jgi:hypothetical protein